MAQKFVVNSDFVSEDELSDTLTTAEHAVLGADLPGASWWQFDSHGGVTIVDISHPTSPQLEAMVAFVAMNLLDAQFGRRWRSQFVVWP